ncbi:cyclic nucleotide-binding domain-containing protein [Sphingomonas sp. NCPPB 2930]
MKGILGLLRSKTPQKIGEDRADSVFFSTAFADQGVDPARLIPWEARAVEVGAKRLASARGVKLLQQLWAKDRHMNMLDTAAVGRMERFFEFASLQANRDVIRQDEYGNFMIVLLSGTIAVDRLQPWGERLRLAETRPGDILGEMSLLDSGIRFSACTSLTDCEIAVLSADAMDEMMTAESEMAASLIALLARKLSLRLRVVSARLSDNK